MVATPLPRGAGVLTSLVRADGLLVVPGRPGGPPPGRAGRGRAAARHRRDLPHDRRHRLARPRPRPRRLRAAGRGPAGHPGVVERRLARRAGGAARRAVPHRRVAPAGPGHRRVHAALPRPDPAPAPASPWSGCVHRDQGLIVAPGNPLGLAGIEDLTRAGVRYVNRQRGAGTRVLLDHELGRRGISPDAVDGYAREEPTHLAVAAAVAAGRADAGLGIMAAARAFGLDFVPVTREPYDLVVAAGRHGQPAAGPAVGAAALRPVPGGGHRARRLQHEGDGPAHQVTPESRPRIQGRLTACKRVGVGEAPRAVGQPPLAAPDPLHLARAGRPTARCRARRARSGPSRRPSAR